MTTNDNEAMDAAIAEARDDGAVAAYSTLSHLLAQMPDDFRAEIRQAFEERGPLPKEAKWCIAHVWVGDMPVAYRSDGAWCVRFPDDRFPIYALIIASDTDRIERARELNLNFMEWKRRREPLN
jgi:hypothetical protein